MEVVQRNRLPEQFLFVHASIATSSSRKRRCCRAYVTPEPRRRLRGDTHTSDSVIRFQERSLAHAQPRHERCSDCQQNLSSGQPPSSRSGIRFFKPAPSPFSPAPAPCPVCCRTLHTHVSSGKLAREHLCTRTDRETCLKLSWPGLFRGCSCWRPYNHYSAVPRPEQRISSAWRSWSERSSGRTPTKPRSQRLRSMVRGLATQQSTQQSGSFCYAVVLGMR